MSANFIYDVFLSHNSKDKPQVRRLAERLKAAGVRVWLDEWVIQAGDIIALKVDEGLEQSRVLLLCISPTALASDWVALERSTAVHRDPANAGRRFIPLLLGDCVLPDTLRRYKYVDFREESEAAFVEVLATCRSEPEFVPSASRPKAEKTGSTEKPTLPNSEEFKLPAALERKLNGHRSGVESLDISPDGKFLVSSSRDKTIRVWNTKSWHCKHLLKGHQDIVFDAKFCENGTAIVSASNDKTVRLWNSTTGKVKFICKGHRKVVWSVAVAERKKLIFSISFDLTIRTWSLLDGKFLEVDLTQGSELTRIGISPSEEICVFTEMHGMVWLFWIGRTEPPVLLGRDTSPAHKVLFSPDSEFVFTCSDDSTLMIWSVKNLNIWGNIEGLSGASDIALSPDGEILASAHLLANLISLWHWRSGTCLATFETDGAPSSVAFSSDGSRLVVGTFEGEICVYRLPDTRLIPTVEAPRRYVNAKIVLLGEGTVGKTSLAHRLIEDSYVVKDRTHGMNIWRLELPLTTEDALEREALLWDLAGQEDYRLIHQLFLEQTALALLLINPQKDDPFAEAGDWLKALKAAVNNHDAKRDPARLLIFSQIDVGGMKLGNAKIDRFREQHGFADWLPISSKSGENCSDGENEGQPSKLKQLIAASIPWDTLPWTTTPRLLAELKNAVMAMRDESDIRLLRFSELAQRLELALPDEKFGELELRTAVTLLANHGLARLLKFGDLVLLRPDLINGYAGALIRAARTHTDEIGCVPEADIYQSDFDFTGVERLKHRPDEELLLRALVQTFLDHSLCIAEDTPHGRHLVFPSQYRREKDIPHEPDIFVSYTFSGEWQTVWTTLVVRLWYSQEFAHRELWRNAAEFESARKQTLGLKITKTGDGTATISLYFDHGLPDELKVIFIEYVHRHLAKYACEVTRDRRYVCSDCGKPVTNIDAVRRRKEAGKDFINCQECDDVKVPFIDFIEERLKSDPVAQKILAMDETATRKLDTQALEQILIGHMMAIAGEANQIFRPVTMFDHGIDGEVEFKDNDGKASGKRIYIQLKSGNSYLRTRKGDDNEVFDVSNDRHLEYWISQPVDVYLVIRRNYKMSGVEEIRWMNVTSYLRARKDKKSRQIIFTGEKLDMEAVWKVRDEFFPPR